MALYITLLLVGHWRINYNSDQPEIEGQGSEALHQHHWCPEEWFGCCLNQEIIAWVFFSSCDCWVRDDEEGNPKAPIQHWDVPELYELEHDRWRLGERGGKSFGLWWCSSSLWASFSSISLSWRGWWVAGHWIVCCRSCEKPVRARTCVLVSSVSSFKLQVSSFNFSPFLACSF